MLYMYTYILYMSVGYASNLRYQTMWWLNTTHANNRRFQILRNNRKFQIPRELRRALNASASISNSNDFHNPLANTITKRRPTSPHQTMPGCCQVGS